MLKALAKYMKQKAVFIGWLLSFIYFPDSCKNFDGAIVNPTQFRRYWQHIVFLIFSSPNMSLWS